jgi:uncharacterized protein (DUF2384 family)
MSDELVRVPAARQRSLTLDELAAAQNVRPTVSLHDLAVDVWDSEAELEAFLDDVARSRRSELP